MKKTTIGHANHALARLILVAAATACAALAADTDLGAVSQIVNPNGTQKPVKDSDGTVPHLYKTSDGKLYLNYHKDWTDPPGTNAISIPPGAKVTLKDGTTVTAQASLPGAQDIFVADLDQWIKDEIAGLVAQTPALGDTFYPLTLSTNLQTLGDAAGLFGDSSDVTGGVIGFDQQANLLSILGSATVDGLTPIVFNLDPSVTPLTVAFSPNVQFVSGSVFNPTPITTFEVTGQEVPEPATNLLIVAGGLLMAAWIRRTRTRGPQEPRPLPSPELDVTLMHAAPTVPHSRLRAPPPSVAAAAPRQKIAAAARNCREDAGTGWPNGNSRGAEGGSRPVQIKSLIGIERLFIHR
jgi:hypothetical protein